jgi:hypothetical protein
MTARRVCAEFVVPSAEVLRERMPADDDARGAVGLEAAHRSEPRFEPSVIALDPVVGVLLGVVDRVWHQLDDDVGQRRGAIGDDLDRFTLRNERSREESTGRSDVATPRQQHVDDLAVLINRPIDVAPHAGDLHIGLIHEPPQPDRMPARSRGVDEQGREPLHPTKERDVIDVDATLGEELLEIAVRQPEAGDTSGPPA